MRIGREEKLKGARTALAVGLVVVAATACWCRLARNGAGDYVVLLHGMRRTPAAMSRLERRLATEGYTVINEGYRSSGESASALVSNIVDTVRRRCTDQTRPVHG